LLSIVGLAAAVGRALHPGDLTALAEPFRERIFRALELEDPGLAQRAAEFERVDSRFRAHPGLTLLHVVPGGLFLLVAPLQFSSRIRARHVAVHRWSGRLLVALAFASVVPGFFFGLLLPYAGAWEAVVVAVFGGLFAVSLGKAVVAIRRREVARHREWMIRAYAVAIGIATTRVVGVVVDLTLSPAGFGPRGLFVLAIAAGWALTVGAAELWLSRTRPGAA
ncbi:MAG TPA: DUF2306 domain-containing protein, partial [Vicinamibacteria bacterium]